MKKFKYGDEKEEEKSPTRAFEKAVDDYMHQLTSNPGFDHRKPLDTSGIPNREKAIEAMRNRVYSLIPDAYYFESEDACEWRVHPSDVQRISELRDVMGFNEYNCAVNGEDRVRPLFEAMQSITIEKLVANVYTKYRTLFPEVAVGFLRRGTDDAPVILLMHQHSVDQLACTAQLQVIVEALTGGPSEESNDWLVQVQDFVRITGATSKYFAKSDPKLGSRLQMNYSPVTTEPESTDRATTAQQQPTEEVLERRSGEKGLPEKKADTPAVAEELEGKEPPSSTVQVHPEGKGLPPPPPREEAQLEGKGPPPPPREEAQLEGKGPPPPKGTLSAQKPTSKLQTFFDTTFNAIKRGKRYTRTSGEEVKKEHVVLSTKVDTTINSTVSCHVQACWKGYMLKRYANLTLTTGHRLPDRYPDTVTCTHSGKEHTVIGADNFKGRNWPSQLNPNDPKSFAGNYNTVNVQSFSALEQQHTYPRDLVNMIADVAVIDGLVETLFPGFMVDARALTNYVQMETLDVPCMPKPSEYLGSVQFIAQDRIGHLEVEGFGHRTVIAGNSRYVEVFYLARYSHGSVEFKYGDSGTPVYKTNDAGKLVLHSIIARTVTVGQLGRPNEYWEALTPAHFAKAQAQAILRGTYPNVTLRFIK